MDRKIRDLIEHLEIEDKELNGKIVSLKLFLDNGIVGDTQRYLLEEQLEAMKKYAKILRVRYRDLIERYS